MGDPVSADVGQRAAFEAAIDAAPDEASLFAVLADWLSHHGDPRGELIGLMLGEQNEATAQRRNALLAHPSLRWGGSSDQWRWGYVHEATLSSGSPHTLDAGTLWRHPSLRFLRALRLSFAEPFEALLTHLVDASPRVLHRLELAAPRPLDLSQLAPTLPLRALSLHAPQLTNTLAAFPGLATLELGGLFDRRSQAAVLFAENQQLRAVTIEWFGAVPLEALTGVLTLPALERLTVRADRTDEGVIDAILDSPLGARLRCLDLSASGLTEPAARRLLDRVREHASLSELILGAMG